MTLPRANTRGRTRSRRWQHRLGLDLDPIALARSALRAPRLQHGFDRADATMDNFFFCSPSPDRSGACDQPFDLHAIASMAHGLAGLSSVVPARSKPPM